MRAATRSLEAGSSLLLAEKARQARGGHRGHVWAATRSLEAGSSFPAHKKRVGECHSPTLFCKNKKARTARIGHRGHVSAATYSLEAGSSLP
ncbi:MAG: hypothetical protein FWF77_09700 [Defluviitaleaceae bacterium]|nr:hypothetical protein [Defluviitaleaceae bacterium]